VKKIENTLLKYSFIVVKQTDASGGYGCLLVQNRLKEQQEFIAK
jgi:hypothetical protein